MKQKFNKKSFGIKGTTAGPSREGARDKAPDPIIVKPYI